MKKKPYDLTGDELKFYRLGFIDGEAGAYFPCAGGKKLAAYDWGHKDGKEQAARNKADADPSPAGICYRKGTLTLKQYRSIHGI